jgi:hypothetical protein
MHHITVFINAIFIARQADFPDEPRQAQICEEEDKASWKAQNVAQKQTD